MIGHNPTMLDILIPKPYCINNLSWLISPHPHDIWDAPIRAVAHRVGCCAISFVVEVRHLHVPKDRPDMAVASVFACFVLFENPKHLGLKIPSRRRSFWRENGETHSSGMDQTDQKQQNLLWLVPFSGTASDLGWHVESSVSFWKVMTIWPYVILWSMKIRFPIGTSSACCSHQ